MYMTPNGRAKIFNCTICVGSLYTLMPRAALMYVKATYMSLSRYTNTAHATIICIMMCINACIFALHIFYTRNCTCIYINILDHFKIKLIFKITLAFKKNI